MTVKNIPTLEESLAAMTELYNESYSNLTPQEVKAGVELTGLVKHQNERKFVMRLLDEVYQIHDPRKVALRVIRLLNKYGLPKSLPFYEQLFFIIFMMLGRFAPFYKMMIPVLRRTLRNITHIFVLSNDRKAMRKNMEEKTNMGICSEISFTGENSVGNREADGCFNQCIEALKNPYVERISVKLTSIYPHTYDLNYKEGREELAKRLSEMYRTAMHYKWTSKSGVKRYKVVMIDMEEYRDVLLTLKIFKSVLSQPEFKNYTAGITIQAYLFNAWDLQTELLDFAKSRQENGGAPLEMRLVKGRRHALETMVNELRGWKSPVIKDKLDVEANYMHMLERAMMLENAKALRVGVATHNLYIIAYARLLARKLGTPMRCYRFELLDGMANHVLRTLGMKKDVQTLVYQPIVPNEEYGRAVAYITRRCDDCFDEETYIAKSFGLKPNTAVWDRLVDDFKKAYSRKDKLTFEKIEHQDRNGYYSTIQSIDKFVNEADTDFGEDCNKRWAEKVLAKWKPTGEPLTGNKCDWHKWKLGDTLPTQIGETLAYNDNRVKYYDKSQGGKVEVCEMSVTDPAQAERVLLAAKTDKSGWRNTPLEKRVEILYKAANNIGMMRDELVGAACAVTGITLQQADAEVSEAMNYCRVYSHFYRQMNALEGVEMTAKGVVLVICPWMFAYTIPGNAIAAALITGNTCVVKLSRQNAPVTWLLANAFWNAGVPKDALQLGITEDSYNKLLASSPFINHICMTGSSSTVESIARINPTKSLHAETSAKNAMILTAKGDMYQAIREACISAFGSAGQSCTAGSILLVERSIYDNPIFQNVLKDCAESIKFGSVWDLGNQYGPLMRNNNPVLMKALTLEKGERWLVEPTFTDEEHYFMSPAVKYGVEPTSYTFRTELDAPLLSVTPFDTLKEAIDMVNDLNFGLTSGLFSLDEKEQKLWKEHLKAGNLFINRNISILKALIQPMGGMRGSAYGPKYKAGGPNYCLQMVNVRNSEDSKLDYKKSYAEWYEEEFKNIKNLSPALHGEHNLMRYLPYMPSKESMSMRLLGDEKVEDIEMVICAAKTVGAQITISVDADNEAMQHVENHFHVIKESLSDFCEHISDYRRLRVISNNVPDSLYAIAAVHNVNVIDGAPIKNGRIELTNYVISQALSHSYSRYGLEIYTPAIE